MQLPLSNSRIEYFPIRGISSFNVPHLHTSNISQLKKHIDAFLASIHLHRARHVVLNFSQTEVSVGEETFRLMLNYLVIGLKYAEASHIARVAFSEPRWEYTAAAVFSQAVFILQRDVQLGDFTRLEDACHWLTPSKITSTYISRHTCQP